MSIAIVDGFSTGRFLAAELSRRGVRCVHVCGPSAPTTLVRSLDRTHYEVDLPWQNDPIDLLQRLREAGVQAVVAGSETGVELADLLNARLGLPGNDPAFSEARRDKYEMGRRLGEAGIPVPEVRLVSSVPEAVKAYEGWPAPEVVLKPRSSAGSDGVRICRSVEEVRSAVGRGLGSKDIFGRSNEDLLMQTLVLGREYYLNTVSENGRHRVVDIWAYQKTETAAGVPFYDYDSPVDLRDPVVPSLESIVCETLVALGVRHGPAHSEVMLTSGGPVLIEVASRLGGGLLPHVGEEFFGCSQTSVTADLLTGGDIFVCRADGTTPEAVRMVQLINRVPGAIPDGDWPERLRHLPSAYAVFPRTTPGEPLPVTDNLLNVPGYAYLAGEPNVVERDYQMLRRWEDEGLYVGSGGVRYGATP